MNNGCAKHYYRQVKKELVCPFKLKRKILRALRSDLEDFIADRPYADSRDINAHFGTPDSFSEQYFESLRTDEIAEAVRFHTTLKQTVCAVSALILLIAIGFCVKSILDIKKDYYVDVTEPVFVITEHHL